MLDMNRAGGYYTVATVAAAFGVNVKTVRRWAARGELPATTTEAGIWLFPTKEVEERLAERGLSVHGSGGGSEIRSQPEDDPTVGSGWETAKHQAGRHVAVPQGNHRSDLGGVERGAMKIVDLLNANPAFVRAELNALRTVKWRDFAKDPELRELRFSMDRDGQVVPILTTPDYLIIDGARRLCAALSLGWATVNVLATSQWETALHHLETTRIATAERSLPFKPMRWLELADLVKRILSPLYAPVRVERMVAARKANTLRVGGNLFSEEFAAAGGIRLSDVYVARDLDAAITLATKSWGPEFGKVVQTYIEDEEIRGTGPYTVLRQARQMANTGPEGPRELLIPQRDLKQADLQIHRIRASIGVIEATGHTLDEITTINPAMDAETARRLRYELQVAIRAVHRMRGRLNEHIEREEG